MNSEKVCIKINEYGEKRIIYARKGSLLKDVLLKEEIKISLPCSGMARCGKCRIQFLEGAPNPTSGDMKFFSEKELQEGYRLLCRCIVARNARISILEGTGSDDISAETMNVSDEAPGADNSSFCYGIAVDLGTTTIAAALVRDDGGSGAVIRTGSCVNHQKSYGADVISRISAAEDEQVLIDMSDTVRKDIEMLIKDLISKEKAPNEIRPIVIAIAGNTTMMHLLMKRDVRGLGKYPYTPKSLSYECVGADQIFGGMEGARVVLFPGISAFVGADIVAGLYYINRSVRDDSEKDMAALFIDLGTNAEMAFYDGKDLFTASAAAGPVFEASHISCGVASVSGAICHVKVRPADNSGEESCYDVEYETIDNEPPVGICGTGVMELVSELVGAGVIDETGLLLEQYFDSGFPVTKDGSVRFTQEDIRNVQLAKAAISSGIKTLLNGKKPDKVYVAGGFGSHMDIKNVKNLRMFPEDFNDNIEYVGNSSLRGMAEFVKSFLKSPSSGKEAAERAAKIADKAQTVDLSANKDFDEDYIASMNF